jgi:aspartyl-tRNA(Asn)/glutamyl-tRNA(Gln) amidotransferase subunit B
VTRSPASGAWDVRYEAVVRVTITTRLATATKLWCGCAVEDGAEPNANTCPVCLGLPGTLPVLNGAAVERGVAGAAALGAEVQRVSDFAREHRPPDPRTPKGYVLTQRRRPLAVRGGVQIGETLEGAPMRAAIKCAYLAEDVGRAVHGRFAHESGLDYNIAGAPLLIIEGEADLRSPPEARAFVASVAALLADSGRPTRPSSAGRCR